jgi:hypothetical protein
VYSEAGYREQIFETMYRDIAPYDPDGILQDEWLNSRGAMSRWDRNAIEIRVIDIQENPIADIAILEWIVNLAKALADENWCNLETQKDVHEDRLYAILLETIRDGEQAEINDPEFLRLFGFKKSSTTAGELCRFIYLQLIESYSFAKESAEQLELIHKEGPLGRRILRALPNNFSHDNLFGVYHRLCNCLNDGKAFIP